MIGVPFFITSRPRREYDFLYIMYSQTTLSDIRKAFSTSSLNWISFLKKAMSLLSPVVWSYISSLAQKVELPPEELQADTIEMGAVSLPFLRASTFKTIQVTYLEDELNSVYAFHTAWQSMVKTGKSDFTCSNTFTGLKTVCLSIAYSPSIPSKIDGVDFKFDIPTGVDVYPNVFPLAISRSAADHAGSGVSTVTVTYIRVPDLSLPTALVRTSLSV